MTDNDTTAVRQALSALADGEADGAAATTLAAAWREDAALRERWHAYHLIGDVLRSDELGACSGDAAFLRRLRERLVREPVVLAPAALEAAGAAPAALAVGGAPGRARPARLRRWAPPAAVAAGFMMVAGALTVLRTPGDPAPTPSAVQLAQVPLAPAPHTAPAAPQLVGPVAGPEVLAERSVPANVLIRDARIDEYLAAHKQFGGSSALGVPSGFLRSATYEGPAGAVPAGR